MRYLRARLLQRAQDEAQATEAASRRSQVGSGERSEKIRTYNFPEGRVTDHRITQVDGRTSHQLPGRPGRGRGPRRVRGPAPLGRARRAAGDPGRPASGHELSRASRRWSFDGRPTTCRATTWRARSPPRRSCWPTCSGIDRAGLYSRDEGLSAAEAKRFGRALCRRCVGVPLQHLTGEEGFRHLVLLVRPGVFIPRPETEILVEHALAAVADLTAPVVVDVGTGTGAIALAIKDERPDGARAGDRRRRPMPSRWPGRTPPDRTWISRSWRGICSTRCPTRSDGAVDLVVSNPPYVEEDELRDSSARRARRPRPRARRRGRYLRAALRAGVRRSAARGGDRRRDRRDAGRSIGDGGLRRRVRHDRRRAGSDRPRPVRDGADAGVAMDPIADALAAVRRGELIVFPTDTVYGIGAAPDDPAATARLFDAKRRPPDLTLPVLIAAARGGRDAGAVRRSRRPTGAGVLARSADAGAAARRREPDVGSRGRRRDDRAARAVAPSGARRARRRPGRSPPPAPTVRASRPPGRATTCTPRSVTWWRCTCVRRSRWSGSASTVVDLTHADARVVRAGALDADRIAQLLGGGTPLLDSPPPG